MNKQTVEQKYQQKQIISGNQFEKNEVKQLLLSPEKENSQQIINIVKQALQEANKSVLQIEASYPLEENISIAKNKLNLALQKLQQLEAAGTSQVFIKGMDQQLKQLQYQLETAAGTLAWLDQALK